MDTVYFTIGTKSFRPLATNMAAVFESVNGVPMFVIGDEHVAYLPPMPSECFIKAYLWDLAPKGTKRIVYADADMLPVRPLGVLPTAPFSAVRDIGNEWERKNGRADIVSDIKNYFNAGFFVATREAIPAFEMLKMHRLFNLNASIVHDQSWFNQIVQRVLGGWNELPPTWNRLTFDSKFDRNEPDVKMFHFICDIGKKIVAQAQKDVLGDQILYVTIGTGPYHEMAENFAKLFERINGKKVFIITDEMVKHLEMHSPHFIKAHLWDLLPPGTKRFCYMDCDILPMLPLGEPPDSAFCAVPEPSAPAWERKNGYPFADGIKDYFNSGVLVCDRRSIPVFDAMKLHRFLNHNFSFMKDQTWFNHFVQIILGGYTPLPATWNWFLYDNELPKNTDAKMFHFIMDPQKKKVIKLQKEKLNTVAQQVSDAMSSLQNGTRTPGILIDSSDPAHFSVRMVDDVCAQGEKKLKIHVYAIAKNESKFVERFMKSCAGADGVHVLDTGSTDDTAEKLRQLGAHVTVPAIAYTPWSSVEEYDAIVLRGGRPWRFDMARNESLKRVPEDADICICIDLDETLVNGWRGVVEKAWTENGRMFTSRLTYKYAWSPDKVFPYNKIHCRHGYEWRYPVHETLFNVGDFNEKFAHTPSTLVRHFADASKPRSQYLPLLELAVRENPNDKACAFYYCRELFFHKKYEECAREAYRFINLGIDWKIQAAAAATYAAKSFACRDDFENAERWHLRACSEEPNQREPWLALADFYKFRHNWAGMYAAAERARECEKSQDTYLNDPQAWGSAAFEAAAIAATRLGLKVEAYNRACVAATFSPEIPRLHEFEEKCRKAASIQRSTIKSERNIAVLWPSARVGKFNVGKKIWIDRANDTDKVAFWPDFVVTERPGVCAPAHKIAKQIVEMKDLPDSDIVVLASDDFIPPEGWDEFLRDSFRSHDGALIVNNGNPPYRGPVVDLPIMTVVCLRKLNGIIYHPEYYHNYADNELWDVLHELKLVKNLRGTSTPVFQHEHWRTKHRERDEVDDRTQAHAEDDRLTYERRKVLPVSERLKI